MEQIKDLISKLIDQGYNDVNAQARIAQDVLLKAIKKSNMEDKVAIKGGVLIRNISKNIRRATADLDIDFVKYSISEETIEEFITILNDNSDYKIQIDSKIEELKHEDYKGKRVYVKISDETKDFVRSKIDIGVHTYKEFRLEESYFEILLDNDGISLLGNSKEQVIAEKLKSLLKFGVATTRYKDIFDIAYLLEGCDKNILKNYIKILLFDKDDKVKNFNDISERLKDVFDDKAFIERITNSNKNWLDIDLSTVINNIKDYFNSIREK